jgi:anti-sigma B factor antagonist
MTGAGVTVTTSKTDGWTLITVAGELDIYTAPNLSEAISELVQGGAYHLVIDLTSVEFLDSTGLGVMVAGLKKVRAHDGSLRLVCNQHRLLKTFRITGLSKVFDIRATLEAALGSGGQDAQAAQLLDDDGPGARPR